MEAPDGPFHAATHLERWARRGQGRRQVRIDGDDEVRQLGRQYFNFGAKSATLITGVGCDGSDKSCV